MHRIDARIVELMEILSDIIRTYRMTVVLSPKLGVRELQRLLRPLAIVAPSEAVSARILGDLETLGGGSMPSQIHATVVVRHLVLDPHRHVLSYTQSALAKHEPIVVRVATNIAPWATRGFHLSVTAQGQNTPSRHYFGPTPAHVAHHQKQSRIEDGLWLLPLALGEDEIVRAMLRKFFNVVGDEPADPTAKVGQQGRERMQFTEYTTTEIERFSEALDAAPKARAVDGYVRRDGISTQIFADDAGDQAKS